MQRPKSTQIAFQITRVFRLAGCGLVQSYCIHASVVRMLQEFLCDNILVRQMYVGIHTYRYYRFYIIMNKHFV